MEKIIECVPNFSEGRDKNKINAILEEIKKINGAKLLNFESDKDHNRTVITFVGEPKSVFNAAFLAIKKAAEVIDMTQHKGAHPRIGATDVCPFIPVSNTAMEECVELAKKLAEKVGEELKIPVYLYEKAQNNPLRKTLPQIREGEYEGLTEKIKLPQWQPDFGPKEFNPKTGATIIGARNFLIAYNVNLDTTDLSIVKEIAGKIRESGVKKEINGQKIQIPGEFKELKALGIEIKEKNLVQVSMNLTDYKTTGMHTIFEKIKELAKEKKVEIVSSEIVGVVPLEAILESGRFYLAQNNAEQYTEQRGKISDKEIIDAAVENMKLDKFAEFNPKKKIIEYAMLV